MTHEETMLKEYSESGKSQRKWCRVAWIKRSTLRYWLERSNRNIPENLKWGNVNMVLSKEDAELFYELWFPLLDFVNKKFYVNPGMGKIHRAKSSDPVKVKEIANVLWDNVQVIDEYLKKYGKTISEENKSIIQS